ncbi:phenylalanine ammonia-lyase [Lanmaoa asiatica]|nr:phenylalanine ammonia-lyase [Lanmaoa asiatica]
MSSLISRYVAHIHELDNYLYVPLSLLPLPTDPSPALVRPSPSPAATSLSPRSPPLPAMSLLPLLLPPRPLLRLSASEHLRAAHDASRHVIASKVEAGLSIYGVSTGFGGSADTRTDDPVALGAALLQHQHAGVVIPSSVSRDPSSSSMAPLPLSDPTHSTTMPPAWTRAAMLVRTNSLLRGHSGVRWELVQKMLEVLEKGIVPLVPLRGSISASGDLSSLSYIAGMLIGNPAIHVWLLTSGVPPPSLHIQPAHLRIPTPRFPVSTAASSTFTSGAATPTTESGGVSPISPSTPASSIPDDEFPKSHFVSQSAFYSALTPSSTTYTAPKALALTNTSPLPLASKEHLGILNGTAFSAGLAALVVNGAKDVVVLGAVLTALSIEAMLGSRGSFDPFVGHARPHPGQIESAHLIWSLLSESKFAQGDEVEVKIEEDQGVLRQDRYSLRTAPQWLGPQFEDIKRVEETIRIEVNSTTDNPLVEPPREAGGEGKVHHAGNFQALSVTNAMDHLRLSLSHIGRLMFVQLTEMINPGMNRGLPGNLSGGESALDFGCKGLDIAAASYAGELNALGGMNVGVGNVSAEIHNQSINSLALISARYTLTALEVSQLMAASHLFVVCQALDARALYVEMRQLSAQVVRDVVRKEFALSGADQLVDKIACKVLPQVYDALDRSTGMDTAPRMAKVASEAVSPLIEALAWLDLSALDLGKVAAFRTTLADRLAALMTELRCAYLGVSLADVRRGCIGSTTTPAQTPLFDIAPRGPTPASAFLAPRTRVLYEFVREELGIRMHGADNLRGSVFGMREGALPGLEAEEATAVLGGLVDVTVGDKVAIIVEAIRDGRMARVLVRLCAGVDV